MKKNLRMPSTEMLRRVALHRPENLKSYKKKNYSLISDWCLTPRPTGRLTLGHDITLT
jgi:hypothetical protein